MALVQERIHDYEKKLDSIRDRLMRLSPEKWIEPNGEDNSACSEEFDFDDGDLTPVKGSVSKIE